MNRGHVLQSSPVQQMVAAGNPNWWSMISSMRPPPLQQYQHQHQPSPPPNFLPHPSNLFPQYAPSNNNYHPPSHFLYDNQELHQESLSQLLLGGLVGEEVEKSDMSHFHELLHHQASNNNNNNNNNVVGPHVKQETSSSSYNNNNNNNNNNNIYGHNHANDEAPAMLVSNSPNSCLTSANNPNMLDFSGKNDGRHPPPDRSSESNSSGGSGGGGAVKKARVQPSSTQSSTSTTTFKVRKEKLGDRITALHQLVSPFGKTDTASVLLEAIGYIRFLQNQIEALSLPYLGNGSGNNIRQQHQQSVHGERNCIFPEDPGQTCNEEPKKDLRSKGLCLVPVSCTLQVGSDNGADYWAPALGRGFQ